MKLRSLLIVCSVSACASSSHTIQGTKVADSDENRRILGAVEQYRLAVERKDAEALLAMASPKYWDDSGTAGGTDDFGYQGLRDVLASRFQRAEDIRYSLHYMHVRRVGNRALVDVLIDASYAIEGSKAGRLDMRDQNEMVLEYDGRRWLFLSGM